jgi:hypothetical protein
MEIKDNDLLSSSSSVSPLQSVQPVVSTAPVKRKAGRPKKSDIQAKLKRETRGRPKGDAGRLAELKARLLATSGERVINKVIEVAMTDGHPGQMAALKLCMDRVLPVSLFEKDTSGASRGITINITGLTGSVSNDEDTTIEAEDVDYHG